MTNSAIQNDMANAIRALSMDAVEKANSGHPGLPMGCADIATALFTKVMKFNPADPWWPDRDRFVLSAGHGSMLLYSSLYLLGYEDMSIEQIKQFRQLNSKTAGHPEYHFADGIETTTGPLGQGLGNSVGMAIAEAKLAAEGTGLLSAAIAEGKRAVSVAVSAEAASGGFISPRDRVDVVLTRASELGQFPETILRNVRILAIDARTGISEPASPDAPPDEPEVFGSRAIATLELGPTESEVVINASTIGRLSLVLRPAADQQEANVELTPSLSANQAIRLSSPFWAK